MLETSVSEATFSATPAQLATVTEPDVTLHRVQLQKFLEKLNGRFIGVDFVKLDGTCRKLNGRLGVHRHCQGGVSTVCKNSRPYITVFDVQSGGYRTLNLATVSAIRADRTAYVVVG